MYKWIPEIQSYNVQPQLQKGKQKKKKNHKEEIEMPINLPEEEEIQQISQ